MRKRRNKGEGYCAARVCHGGERVRETLTLDNFFKEARIFSFRAAPPKTRLSELTPSPSEPLLSIYLLLSPPKPTPSKILVLIFTFFLNIPVLVSLLKECTANLFTFRL